MPKIVFILGAGASAEGGCPVMRTFFTQLRRLHTRGRLAHLEAEYQALDRVIRILRQAQSKANNDVDNMESIFNALEMATVVGRLGQLRAPEAQEAKVAFIRLTCAVLEQTQVFQRSQSGDRVFGEQSPFKPAEPNPPEKLIGPMGLDLLARVVKHLRSAVPQCECAIVSFNYDLGAEISLLARGMPIDYCLSGSLGVADAVRVLKLHGSLNWFDGPEGVTARTDILDAAMRLECCEYLNDQEPQGNRRLLFRISQHLTDGPDRGRIPLIVPPSESKASDRPKLVRLWSQASDAIADADVLVIVGYSMPTTDEFFRQLVSVSIANDHYLRRVYVLTLEGDPGGRFTALFGMPMRTRIVPLGGSMSATLPNLIRDFDLTAGTFE